jgi:hypothetical protein
VTVADIRFALENIREAKCDSLPFISQSKCLRVDMPKFWNRKSLLRCWQLFSISKTGIIISKQSLSVAQRTSLHLLRVAVIPEAN